MSNTTPTFQEIMLYDALVNLGIKVESQHSDGYKHVDLYIPSARLYIEVDGYPHFDKPEQILADYDRDKHSEENGIHTMHIPNSVIEQEAHEVAKAIAEVARIRENKNT